MNNSVSIRHAERDELYTIATFLDECWREAYSSILSSDYLDKMSTDRRHENFIKQYDSGSAKFLTMYEGSQLIGVAVYGKSITEGFENDGEISAIYLRSNSIGKGYGRELFTEAEWLLKEMGYKSFVIDVFTANERAIRFYLKHGYEAVDNRTICLGGNEYPLMVMQKKTENEQYEVRL